MLLQLKFYSNYELMNEKCLRIDQLKQQIEENFEKMIELEEQ